MHTGILLSANGNLLLPDTPTSTIGSCYGREPLLLLLPGGSVDTLAPQDLETGRDMLDNSTLHPNFLT